MVKSRPCKIKAGEAFDSSVLARFERKQVHQLSGQYLIQQKERMARQSEATRRRRYCVQDYKLTSTTAADKCLINDII
ncbi:hypothetical protein L596_022092 [Steinernema carpocapsae]|uniref:Uncharacterized protein n=1 Tax=Steinernema carpocapsae TaxID=34508 RepID=A0A4U5MKP2_STECR|nr:hypothetical protein L596_022092 [Steinernema carpocapsae]